MFGLLIPPRPLLTPAQMTTLSPTQSAYTFPASPPFAHLSVFALPDSPLATATTADALAAIYIRLPGAADFTLLGALGPGKLSATFKVRGGGGGAGAGALGADAGAGAGAGAGEVDMDADESPGMAAAGAAGAEGEVTVGISIEPAATLEPQLAAIAARQAATAAATAGPANQVALIGSQQQQQTTQGVGQPSTKVLAQRIIKNAFNFLASFEGGDGKVSLKSFEDWWKKFERRVEVDPGFLEREGE